MEQRLVRDMTDKFSGHTEKLSDMYERAWGGAGEGGASLHRVARRSATPQAWCGVGRHAQVR